MKRKLVLGLTLVMATLVVGCGSGQPKQADSNYSHSSKNEANSEENKDSEEVLSEGGTVASTLAKSIDDYKAESFDRCDILDRCIMDDGSLDCYTLEYDDNFEYVVFKDRVSVSYIGGLGEEVTYPSSYKGLTVFRIGGVYTSQAPNEDDLAKVKKVTIPESVWILGAGAFERMISLEDIQLPEGIIAIGTQCFNDCNSLTSVTLPNSMWYLGPEAFRNCENLKAIMCSATDLECSKNAFDGAPFDGFTN